MSKLLRYAGSLLLSASVVYVLAGCGQSRESGTESGPGAVETTGAGPETGQMAHEEAGEEHTEHAGHEEHAEHKEAGTEKEAAGGQADKIAAALAKLSDEDRAAALKQKTCPVSGQLLGAMGTPVKVTVKGKEVFLCCPGCKPAIEKDPDKYLAKLGK